MLEKLKAVFSRRNPAPEAAQPEQPLREAVGVSVDPDEDQWRKLTGDGRRDLTPMTQARMIKLAHYLWETNLVANRIIELPLAYLLAEGVRLVAVDEAIQDTLDRFWRDPINQMDLKLVKKCRELALFGEQCWPTFVNTVNGHVRLGYLDPSLIETVVTDPDNAEQPIGIVTTKDGRGRARRYRVIVNGPEQQLFTRRTQGIRETFDDGDCFYFRVNDLSSGTRGRADLLAQIDWLDTYDKFLFGELDRQEFLRAFIWDVTLEGATPDEVRKRAGELRAPAPGGMRVHNSAEKWDAVTPELAAGDASDTARLFRNHVMGGATLPEHWYGGGGDVNRATAGEMSEPTFKMFSMRQTYIGYILTMLGQYAIRQEELAVSRREPDLLDPIYAFEVQWPEMVARDTTAYAAALQQVTVAVSMLITAHLITRERGLQIIEKLTAKLGVEFDTAAELDAALDEARKDAENDVFTDPPPDPEDDADADA